MPELHLSLCGQTTAIACSDEDEPRLRHLVSMVSQRAENARAIVGDNDRWRQLVFAAIFLADELDSGEQGAQAPGDSANDAGDGQMILDLSRRIAASLDRMEAAFDGALEEPRANA